MNILIDCSDILNNIYPLTKLKMKKTINGELFQITNVSGVYIIAKRDGEEFRVPYRRSQFKTLKGALKRCEELSK